MKAKAKKTKIVKKVQNKNSSRTLRIAKIVGLILLIPLFGTIFVDGWDWGLVDFVFAGVMFFAAGLAIDFIERKFTNPVYRILAFTAVIGAFLAIWAEMAVDAVSKALSLIF